MSATPDRVAQLVYLTGDPERLSDDALSTFVAMAQEADGDAPPGHRLLLVDRDSATLVLLSLFASAEELASRRTRTRAAIEVATVLMGGDPDTARIETFDVLTSTLDD